MMESAPYLPPFRALTFGNLRVERLIDAQRGTYAAVPSSAFRRTYLRIVLRSFGSMRTLASGCSMRLSNRYATGAIRLSS